MNTQVTIEVPFNAQDTLKCAYESLLSMGMLYKQITPYLSEDFLLASACVKWEPSGLSPFKYACLITVRKTGETSCELVFTSDRVFTSSAHGNGYIVLFMSEFLQRLNQNLSLE